MYSISYFYFCWGNRILRIQTILFITQSKRLNSSCSPQTHTDSNIEALCDLVRFNARIVDTGLVNITSIVLYAPIQCESNNLVLC
jgi:hypothetical protein